MAEKQIPDTKTWPQVVGASLFLLLDRAIDWKPLAIIMFGFLGYVWMLPEQARAGVSVGEFLQVFTAAGPFWLVYSVIVTSILGLVLLVAYFVHTAQQRRIDTQGEELRKLRQSQDPKRLSSLAYGDLESHAKNRHRDRVARD